MQMSKYLITYYLAEEAHECGCNGHDHDHEHDHDHDHDIRDDYELVNQIKDLGPWAHLMPTSFFVRTELTSSEIFEKLKGLITPKDIIYVNKIDTEDIACSTPGAVKWIQKD